MEMLHTEVLKNKNDLQNAFFTAKNALEDAPFETDFQQLCQARGLNPTDQDSPDYWQLMSHYQLEKSKDEKLSGFESRSLVLAAATPDAVIHQLLVDESFSRDEKIYHKTALSQYNSLVRDFAANYSDISASGFTTELQKVAHVTVTGHEKRIQSQADYLIRSVVRGAQHELGFKSILDASELKYRTTTTEEDLHGGDLVVTIPDGRDIKVDVKASLSEIDKHNRGSNGQPYYINHRGDLVIYSCLSESDFGDTFDISDETAESRVPIVLGALFQASRQKSA